MSIRAETTKIYKNTGKKTVVIPELALELKPGAQVSIKSEFHTPVNLVNYPHVKELVAEENTDE